ncbi:hypothetical protein AN1806.2 [Aspergillus nidulans FGSC A4]|uniref:Nephrocystin 3-like N-terminal domain-containing protein n=1 Tax=Emericella nidulans (strain FGSC A4 / ATCC 38163 / CBS 112.46 / NRRL 194 / M139) TaxID=227321 RepID=Q5BCC4_EMENI|nr:hypothetical protein [Aspergillus nidulans FGSC A4]EAA64971.1 hypothetical protein AN1806.2 [Aspergillus nidulans FGSC A4]CBF85596.1 TPA: conserved hypothetical protein [Aspergillus nidulans FGSC A4]|eukprot:XP_659410.1 hypothetical protein AN1806.2 [Aspergillus nidulans FGSC A4]
MAAPPSSRTDFRIAILCPLPLEAEVVKPLFSRIYHAVEFPTLLKVRGDPNSYTLGRIGTYDVALVHMPSAGKAVASSVVAHMKMSYPRIQIAFLIGICGGVPFIDKSLAARGNTNIYLGDVIIGTGVVQYDRLPLGPYRKDALEENLGRPNQEIHSFLSKIKTRVDTLSDRQCRYLAMIQRHVRAQCPGAQYDIVYSRTYNHREVNCQCSLGVDADETVVARRRNFDVVPFLHFGTLGSGDSVIMSHKFRDDIAKKQKVIGFEMEAAGVWGQYPCILVKGVSDYADSHKSKRWQYFAAASAAACMRALLDEAPISVNQESTLGSISRDHVQGLFSIEKAQEVFIRMLGFGRTTFRLNEVPEAHKETYCVVLSFFFSIKGADLERSAIEMYRSLLHQLFSSRAIPPDAKDRFSEIAFNAVRIRETSNWCIRDLKGLLLSVIQSLRNQRVLLIIDALDQCRQDERGDTILFLQHLVDFAMASGAYLKVCLSSRHYPNLNITYGIELVLENQPEHHSDIRKYVESTITGVRSRAAKEVQDKICVRASGVFLWVHRVVPSLNEAFKMGDMRKVQHLYDETPHDLERIFTDILTSDEEDIDDLILCLQLVLLSSRPLSREELYFAISFADCGLARRDIDLQTDTALDRFIVHVSKGLIEVVQSRAQFIHESLRDFLLRRNSLSTLRAELRQNIIGRSHEKIARVCLNYIYEVSENRAYSDVVRELADLPRHMRSEFIRRRIPFLGYACSDFLYHFKAAQAAGVLEAPFLNLSKIFQSLRSSKAWVSEP